MAMFRPILAGQLSPSIKQNSMDAVLVKCLGVLFTGRSTQEYMHYCDAILNQGMLGKYCDRAGKKLKEIGVLICVSLLSGLFEFGATKPDGSSRSLIRQEYETMSGKGDTKSVAAKEISLDPGIESNQQAISINHINHACKITFGVFAVGLEKYQDRNIIPMIHAFTAFLNVSARNTRIMQLIETEVPWNLLVAFLNHYTNPGTMTRTCLGPNFPKPADDQIGRPLPEDFVMRGQMAFYNYFPPTWFTDADVDEEEKILQLPSMAAPRLSRILWNGICIAKHNKWIAYDEAIFRFSITDYTKSLKPLDWPTSFEPGTLPPELEKLVPPTPANVLATIPSINTPTVSDKSESMDFDYSGATTSPRQVFTQTPKILKRESKGDGIVSVPSTPTKTIQPEMVDRTEEMLGLSPPTA